APEIKIPGASTFSSAFALHCKEMGVPSLIVDVSEEHLQCAKVKGLNTYNGQVLSEQLQLSSEHPSLYSAMQKQMRRYSHL
ncbi:hypothetical protein ACT453_56660, partial [Bacillus sp. D-CC]